MTSLFLAWKDLSKDWKMVLLIMFLLSFSFLNLTVFASFVQGLSNTFQNDLINTQTGHLLLEPSDERALYIENFDTARKKLTQIPGVLGAAAHIQVPATLRSDFDQLGASVIAVDPKEERTVTAIEDQVIEGDFLGDDDRTHIVLGKEIAGQEKLAQAALSRSFGLRKEGLNVRVGDKVRILFENGEMRELTVNGIAGRDGPGIVSRSAFISTALAEEVLGIQDVASSILVKLPRKEMAQSYKSLVAEQGIVGADIKTWEEASSFAEALGLTFGAVIFITSVIGVLIAVITVSSVIFLNVSRKRRSIAVLKAIGTSQKTILFIFLLEGALFGVVGVIAGTILSNVIVGYFALNPLDLPVGLLVPELKSEYVVRACVAILGSSLLAGYLPARSAAKQDILKHIRTT